MHNLPATVVRKPDEEQASLAQQAFLSSHALDAVSEFSFATLPPPILWPVSVFYGKPELFALIPVVGFASAVAGLNSTSMFVLQRRLMQGRLVVLDVANYALSQAITIAWVWYHPTVWALVVGCLIA